MAGRDLDETDIKIIAELRRNSRISMTDMGKRVFLTSQAVKNRLERLQDLGVVERYTVNVNCPIFGYTVHGVFDVDMPKEWEKSFCDFVRGTEFHILHCYHVGVGQFRIDAHFVTGDEKKAFIGALEAFGKVHVYDVLNEVHGIHAPDE
ncbi:MAG: Lrp/AsnC family transcriptional regulator [Dialister sp.]|nr:Lrp/AsnC family transcriptional regulator [Dialister sp.]